MIIAAVMLAQTWTWQDYGGWTNRLGSNIGFLDTSLSSRSGPVRRRLGLFCACWHIRTLYQDQQNLLAICERQKQVQICGIWHGKWLVGQFFGADWRKQISSFHEEGVDQVAGLKPNVSAPVVKKEFQCHNGVTLSVPDPWVFEEDELGLPPENPDATLMQLHQPGFVELRDLAGSPKSAQIRALRHAGYSKELIETGSEIHRQAFTGAPVAKPGNGKNASANKATANQYFARLLSRNGIVIFVNEFGVDEKMRDSIESLLRNFKRQLAASTSKK